LVRYFGVSIRNKSEGLKLTRENYVNVNSHSSLAKGKFYSDSFITKQLERSLSNFDLNIKYFKSLSNEEFNWELNRFIQATEVFKEVTDLSIFDGIPGYYILVLDEYSQVYIGCANNIKKRTQSHWSKQKEFDRLVFGTQGNSKLSIDSFRAYDTTRIFAYPTNNHEEYEESFIESFNEKYILNRTIGGKLDGLAEATLNAKTRKLK
jgi:hypothetical protein